MTLSNDAIANVRYRIRQKAADIDNNPDLAMIRVAIAIDRKTRKVRACYIHIEEEFDPAPPGVLLDLALDKPS